jgi:hypothetical protein
MQARTFLLALVLLVGPALAAGQSPPVGGALRFRLETAHPSIRSSAPFSITCVLNSTLPDVLKGELALAFLDEGQVCLRVNCDSIVVPSDETSIRVVLPSMAVRRNLAAFAVRAVFHSSKGTFDLGNHDLVVPVQGNRQFLIAAPNLGQEIVGRLAGRLRLDSFRPVEKDSRRAHLVTLPVNVETQDLPALGRRQLQPAVGPTARRGRRLDRARGPSRRGPDGRTGCRAQTLSRADYEPRLGRPYFRDGSVWTACDRLTGFQTHDSREPLRLWTRPDSADDAAVHAGRHFSRDRRGRMDPCRVLHLERPTRTDGDHRQDGQLEIAIAR